MRRNAKPRLQRRSRRMPCARRPSTSALSGRDENINAHLSGEMVGKSTLFSGFTCDLNDASRTNCPTQAANLQTIPQRVKEEEKRTGACTYAPRKALNGKSVTRMQYAKTAIPESIVNTRKLSMSFNLAGVVLRYACHSCDIAVGEGVLVNVFAVAITCGTAGFTGVATLTVAADGLRGVLGGMAACGTCVVRRQAAKEIFDIEA